MKNICLNNNSYTFYFCNLLHSLKYWVDMSYEQHFVLLAEMLFHTYFINMMSKTEAEIHMNKYLSDIQIAINAAK